MKEGRKEGHHHVALPRWYFEKEGRKEGRKEEKKEGYQGRGDI
jgi:hypothetical protein